MKTKLTKTQITHVAKYIAADYPQMANSWNPEMLIDDLQWKADEGCFGDEINEGHINAASFALILKEATRQYWRIQKFLGLAD